MGVQFLSHRTQAYSIILSLGFGVSNTFKRIFFFLFLLKVGSGSIFIFEKKKTSAVAFLEIRHMPREKNHLEIDTGKLGQKVKVHLGTKADWY